MKKPTRAEMANVNDSFFADDGPELELCDRSTLEGYSICPCQIRSVEAGLVGKAQIASSGNETHLVCSKAITDYIELMEDGTEVKPWELADTVLLYAYQARPDVQPDVVKAIRPMLYGWCKFICGIAPFNILRYDGGLNQRSGQLAWDWPDLGLRITSELDFLHAGPSVECLHLVDLKAGFKQYTATDVRDSFQFGLHAWLVFQNYPDVQALSVRVWNARVNRLTFRVEFARRDFAEIEHRIRSAAVLWKQWHNVAPEKAPTWPTLEKCRICDAAIVCPAATIDAKTLADDSAGLVDVLVSTEARVKAIKKMLTAKVKQNGVDIVSPSGAAFGLGNPKAERAPSMATYSVASDEPESEAEA